MVVGSSVLWPLRGFVGVGGGTGGVGSVEGLVAENETSEFLDAGRCWGGSLWLAPGAVDGLGFLLLVVVDTLVGVVAYAEEVLFLIWALVEIMR